MNTINRYAVLFTCLVSPQINAMANRASGKGYENESFYQNIKFHFFGIENIHVMRNSLSKLVESKWLLKFLPSLKRVTFHMTIYGTSYGMHGMRQTEAK